MKHYKHSLNNIALLIMALIAQLFGVLMITFSYYESNEITHINGSLMVVMGSLVLVRQLIHSLRERRREN